MFFTKTSPIFAPLYGNRPARTLRVPETGRILHSEHLDDARGEHIQRGGRPVRVQFRGDVGLRGAEHHLAGGDAGGVARTDARNGRIGPGFQDDGGRGLLPGQPDLHDDHPVHHPSGPRVHGPAPGVHGTPGPAARGGRGDGAPVRGVRKHLHRRPSRFHAADVLPVILHDGGAAAARDGDVHHLRRHEHGAGRPVHRGLQVGPRRRGGCVDARLLRGRFLPALVFLHGISPAIGTRVPSGSCGRNSSGSRSCRPPATAFPSTWATSPGMSWR